MFQNIAIVGLGLIGGSLAKALKTYHYGATIYGYNRNKDAINHALNSKVIDYEITNLDEFSICDLIVLCCPVQINIDFFNKLKPYLKDEVVITDVGSTKGDIYSKLDQNNFNGYFIGGHPMAGSEKSGYMATKSELFENAYYILTPSPTTPENLIVSMENLIQTIKGIPIVLDPYEHDYIVAAISHVPHILAALCVNMIKSIDTKDQKMYSLAAGGFRDFTRIAASSPTMWEQISIANKDSILKILDIYKDNISEIRDSIESLDSKNVHDFFERSRDYRRTFDTRTHGSLRKTHILVIDIFDRPGAIATVATTLAVNNISIKNIGINNNREDYEGVLEILFYDNESLEKAKDLLTKNNYNIIQN